MCIFLFYKKVKVETKGQNTTDAVTTAENAVMYGAWIDTIINLLIVGFVLFMIVKTANKAKKKEEVMNEENEAKESQD